MRKQGNQRKNKKSLPKAFMILPRQRSEEPKDTMHPHPRQHRRWFAYQCDINQAQRHHNTARECVSEGHGQGEPFEGALMAQTFAFQMLTDIRRKRRRRSTGGCVAFQVFFRPCPNTLRQVPRKMAREENNYEHTREQRANFNTPAHTTVHAHTKEQNKEQNKIDDTFITRAGDWQFQRWQCLRRPLHSLGPPKRGAQSTT